MSNIYYLAIDPGLSNVGYSVFYNNKPIYGGVITTEKPKLKHIFNQIQDIIINNNISICILENVFVRNGAKSSLNLSAARGIIVLLCQIHNIEIVEVNSNTVRKLILSSGKSDKQKVISYVKSKLEEEGIIISKINHNLADSLLLGYYLIQISNNDLKTKNII